LSGDAALHGAARAGDTVVVEALLQAKAEASIANRSSHAPLDVAFATRDEAVGALLLKYGAVPSPFGMKATLHAAAQVGLVFWATYVIRERADPDVPGTGEFAGRSALSVAIESGHVAATAYLLKVKAQPNAGNPPPLALTALAPSARRHCAAITRLLLDASADALATYGREKVPVLLAAVRSPEAASILLEAAAEVESADVRERTPLLHAAAEGTVEVCRLLVAAAANLGARDRSWQTALHLSAGSGNLPCVEYFLAHGVPIAEEDWEGKEALHMAAEGGPRLEHRRNWAEEVSERVACRLTIRKPLLAP
jgi:ankyrin repeat protein